MFSCWRDTILVLRQWVWVIKHILDTYRYPISQLQCYITSDFKRPTNKFSRPVRYKIETYISCLWHRSKLNPPSPNQTIIGPEHRSAICRLSHSPPFTPPLDPQGGVIFAREGLIAPGSCRLTRRLGSGCWSGLQVTLLWNGQKPVFQPQITAYHLLSEKHPHQ